MELGMIQKFSIILFFIHFSHSMAEEGQQLVENETNCLTSLHDVQVSLKSNPYNLESIDDGFFPPNTHPSPWVRINYYFNQTNSIKIHPAAYEAIGTNSIPDLSFQWVASPVFHYFGPSVMEVFSTASIYFSPTEIHIVIDPICGNEHMKELVLLEKLSAKIQMLSSIEGTYKKNGFVTLLPTSNETVATETYGGVILGLILAAQYTLCFAWMSLVPVLLRKLQLLPIAQRVLTDSGQEKFCLFWGCLLVTVFLMVGMFLYDLMLFTGLKSESGIIIAAVVTFPIPALVFFGGNLISTIKSINGAVGIPKYAIKTKAEKRCVKCVIVSHVLASVLLTLFLQELSFHIGWLALMLVTFPARVGTLCISFIMIYLAATLFLSGFIQGVVACTTSGKTRSREMLGGSQAVFGLSFITLAYYVTITMSGVGYHDGLSAIMPTLSPIIAVGLLTWVLGGFRRRIPGTEGEMKILEVMWQQATNGIGKYYEKEMRDLPV